MADDILGFGVLENKKNQLLYAIITGTGVPDDFVTENEEQDLLKYIANHGTASGGGGAIPPAASEKADWVTNTALGNIPANTDLSGMTSMDIWRMATVSYVKPKANVSYSVANSNVEIGTTINVTVTVTGVTGGTNAVQSMQLYNGSTVVQTINYTGASTYSFNALTLSNTSTLKVRVIDTEGQYTDLTSKTYTFIYPSYYGVTDEVPTGITGLTKALRTKGTLETRFTTDFQHIVYVYPATYGSLRSILDSMNFENITDFTVTDITVNGVAYKMYYTSGKKTSTNFLYKFSF